MGTLSGRTWRWSRRFITSSFVRLWKMPVATRGPIRTTALWVLSGYAGYVIYRVATGTTTFDCVLGSEVGSVVGNGVILCFMLGLGVRAFSWLRSMAPNSRDSRRRQGPVGRSWDGDVPRRRRRSKRDDDPELPLSRRRL
jgi:hypothetical protein